MHAAPGIRREKALLAKLASATGVCRALAATQRALLRNRFVRAVNYHGTPARNASRLEEQLEWYSTRYSPVSHADLARFLTTGEWLAPRPGLILSFDDGLRSNYEIARPLLEKHGFIGWFFVPSMFVGTGGADSDIVARHHITPDDVYPDGRVMMSERECRELAAAHVVGCHTRTHRRLGPDVPADVIHDEVVHAKSELERVVDRTVDVFCWVGGEEASYSSGAARAISNAGFRFSFMTNSAPITGSTDPLHLQRTNIEASWPLDVAAFQLSGAIDLLYRAKRNRVNRATRT